VTFLTRLGSAAVMIAVLIGVLLVGGVVLDAAVLAVAVLASWEVRGLARKSGTDVGPVLPLVVAGFFALHALTGTVAVYGESAVAAAIVVGLIWSRYDHRIYRHVVGIGLGAYVGLIGFFLDLYRWPGTGQYGGLKLVVVAIAAAALTDTGAYLIGSAVGRHKLAPRLSPSKTIEGALGGCLVATAALAVFAPALIPVSTPQAAILGLVLSVAGQTGDLLESTLKRQAGVKDASNLIPGHGGLLDRLDSLLLVAPMAYVCLRLMSLP
jgi:phosphatidate cytidylyltransferase